jgi:hypothetical protein
MDPKPSTHWRIIAASAVGSSHLYHALPCQDAFAFRLLPEGGLLAAVSDGAGSAVLSQEGARRIVDWVLAGLADLCQGEIQPDEAGWQAAITALFAETRQKLADYASAQAIPLNDLAATLTCALVIGDWLVVGQIGDGAAIIEEADGVLSLAIRPQRGEYANEAYLLTQTDAVNFTAVTASRRSIWALALATDGLLRLALKLPEYSPHPQFFHPLFSYALEAADETQAQAELADFLASARVNERTDDDKTLLLAVRMDRASGRVHQRKRRKNVRV